MTDYGRFFEFRVSPKTHDRMGKFASPEEGALVMGAPVLADHSAGFNRLGLQIVKLAEDEAAPVPGECGIAIYEHAPAWQTGYDPFMTTYSDLDTIPLDKALQVVHGAYVKVCFRNIATRSFYGQRTYTGRKMVNGLGATPTVTEGDYLVPGAGNDTDGYWKSQATAADAWLLITKVDVNRGEVEAQMLF